VSKTKTVLDNDEIIASLCEGGSVASLLPFYEPRQAQLDLLSLIIRGFNEDALVMAEAGTGVGKSFAYLLPAMRFSLKNKPVIISTATITLQQQLYEKDIPLVASSMGDVKIKSVIMKGRGNYLCLRRLNDSLQETSLFENSSDEVQNICEWSKTTKTGARSELSFMPSDLVWASVCSESDLCLGNHCLFKERCFITVLRKEANNAHIIVVNHHLLFADLAARLEGAGYENAVILPPFTRLIIDEAHTIENAATSFFSAEFARSGIFKQLGRLYHKRKANHYGLLVKLCAMLPSSLDPLDDMADAVTKIKNCAEELNDCAVQLCAGNRFEKGGNEGIFRLSASADESFLKRALFPHLKALKRDCLALTNIIRDIIENLDEKAQNLTARKKTSDDSIQAEMAADSVVWEIRSIVRRLENISEICEAFCKYKKLENEILWIEKSRLGKDPIAVFKKTPLDLSPKLKESVFTPNKTVICVSATLAIHNDFSFWAAQSGISLIENRLILSGCFPSPFPYSSAVLLAAPTENTPLPDDISYQDFVNNSIKSLVSVAGGSALILFTSYQSLTSAYNTVKNELEKLGIRCLKQGDDDRTRLLQSFLQDETSCLFATDSFWEGVDAPGNTLRLVIICRLPFRTPGDPVFEARREALEKSGKNPFMELSLPHAVIKFRQGFGRLMRRSKDHGVVAVLDSRLQKKTYGQLFLHSLPETRTSFGDLNNILLDMENFLY
jgi:ATP-dependent DNA helicase DinG